MRAHLMFAAATGFLLFSASTAPSMTRTNSNQSQSGVASVYSTSSGSRTSSGKALAKHHHLPPRHLEPVLQALVREGILKAVRGPGGGYVLAREQRRITADDILRAARTVDVAREGPVSESALLVEVVGPALAKAENAFSNTLARITVEDLTRSATLRARKGRNFV